MKYEVIAGPTLTIGIFRQSRNNFPFGFETLMKQGMISGSILRKGTQIPFKPP